MPQKLLFETVQRDHYSYTRLNRAAINELRTAPSAGGDEEAAHALIDLLIDDLPQDPEHDGLMDNSETGAVIRCLKAVLRRLGAMCRFGVSGWVSVTAHQGWVFSMVGC